MAECKIDSRTVERPSGTKVIVAEIHGRADISTVHQIETQVMVYFNDGARHLVLDCSRLEYMNSTGTGLMVKLTDVFKSAGGSFQLTNVPKAINDLMDVLGLLPVFSVAKDVDTALATVE